MHQIHNNETGYLWQERGRRGTIGVKANSGRRRLTILGALNPLTLIPTTILTEDNCDAEMQKALMKEIRHEYPGEKQIVIILDNAPYQHAYDVVEKAESLGIKLDYLPPYSPNLNLIERLWKYFKKSIIKNHYYPTFDEFYENISLFFQTIESRNAELKTLLSFKFEIIKAS